MQVFCKARQRSNPLLLRTGGQRRASAVVALAHRRTTRLGLDAHCAIR